MHKIEMFYENFKLGEDEYCAVIRITRDVNNWLNATKTELIRIVSITHSLNDHGVSVCVHYTTC